MTSLLEKQLWEWLKGCDERKPWHGTAVLGANDKAVRLLQHGVREGDEAMEAEDFPS